MTTVTFIPKKCYVCGTVGRQAEIGMREVGDPEDLDFRAGGVGRSSIYMWVQRCLSCGYCAPDIASGVEAARTVVGEDSYKNQLLDERYSEIINSFLCWAMVLVAEGSLGKAAWATIYAAWVCDDDAEHRTWAPHFRRQAVALIEAAHEKGMTVTGERLSDRLLLIDLHRRCGVFEAAGRICEEELEKGPDPRAQAILLFQQDLIEEGDTRRHRIEEAVDEDR